MIDITTLPPEVVALVHAARECAATDDQAATYDDRDDGNTYRTCCHALVRFYPYLQQGESNEHAVDCSALALSAALVAFAGVPA